MTVELFIYVNGKHQNIAYVIMSFFHQCKKNGSNIITATEKRNWQTAECPPILCLWEEDLWKKIKKIKIKKNWKKTPIIT